MNCEAYSSFEGVSSDHRIVTAKIRLSLRKNATQTATNLQILRNIRSRHHQTSEDEISKKRITRKRRETKVNRRYLIKWINTWVVPLARYSGPFLKWTREEIQEIEIEK